MASRIERTSGAKPISTSRFAVVPAEQLGDRARHHDQQQEGEDPGLDPERAERHLLVGEHAGDADHAAVDDRDRRTASGGWRARGLGST